jgi:endo-1,4-beta-D-glucanase Y
MKMRAPGLVLAAAVFLAAAFGCARSPDEVEPPGAGNGNGGTTGLNGQLGRPFGSHKTPYAAGVILPSGEQTALDATTAAFYDGWKAAYLKAGCGADRNYVLMRPPGKNPMTVSEAHGYGMMITAMMAGHDPAAKTTFDGLYRYFRDHPSAGHRDLMAWSQDEGCRNSSGGSNSATDGDLDIAYGLLLADRQWGSDGAINYFREGLKVLDGILRRDVSATTNLTLLGDWVGSGSAKFYPSTRPSDWMLGHFAAFASASTVPRWTTVLEAHYAMLPKAQNPDTGLFPDFLVGTESETPAPAMPGFLEGDGDGSYAYNACRVPWRLGTAYVLSGDARLIQPLQKLNGWIRTKTAEDPQQIDDGYKMDGASLSPYVYNSMAFVPPFGVSAMVDANNQGWLDQVWKTITETPLDEGGYYENSIKLLSMLVMSGNWWAP